MKDFTKKGTKLPVIPVGTKFRTTFDKKSNSEFKETWLSIYLNNTNYQGLQFCLGNTLYLTKLDEQGIFSYKTFDISKAQFDLNDQNGKKTKLTLWFTAGDDSFGLMSRCKRMVTSVQSLLGEGEVCHFHSKVMQKEPRVGGAWEWHQDYGYWYKNQFMFPDQLVSVMVALTIANKENGCIQVIKGSHKLGRLNHGFAGEQVGADI